ncbi:hypothetical protein OUZ56_026605 [Daphnia magna]|uniref:Regulatory protein zeste n=1 Tax=Daphnia magna TaxID=35525 RepID=A0ABQ9ZM92_9CRUS|nr:hypothetical protein OUZ56_026605 [Daphnia magna]
MNVELPDSKVRTVEIIKKKWDNFSQSAKAAIANHKAGLTETVQNWLSKSTVFKIRPQEETGNRLDEEEYCRG